MTIVSTLTPQPADRTLDAGASLSSPVASIPQRVLTVAHTWIAIVAVFLPIDLWRRARVALTDGEGRPFGDDFINYWSGGALALQGLAADAYRFASYHAFQESIAGAPIAQYHYSYPPMMMLLMMPLALAPYVPAFVIWTASTWAMFWQALRLAMPNGGALLLALAAPAVFVNAYNGQNGALTAALLGGGLCLLERRPALAGVLFGLLIYKPHLGILLPIALIAGRQWRAFIAAGATALALIAASAVLFGPSIFADYARFASVLRVTILENGADIGWNRMVSVFVFARQLGLDVPASYAVQAIAALCAAAVVATAWFTDRAAPVRYALLVLGTMMATPYLQDYDLVIAIFVVVWLWQTDGIEPRLRIAACAALLLVPMLAGPIAKATDLALGALFILPAFAIAVQLAWRERSASGASALQTR
ncbi:MAG: glycosyltransferase family 87 protein [Pseudomonadota bacterium]